MCSCSVQEETEDCSQTATCFLRSFTTCQGIMKCSISKSRFSKDNHNKKEDEGKGAFKPELPLGAASATASLGLAGLAASTDVLGPDEDACTAASLLLLGSAAA